MEMLASYATGLTALVLVMLAWVAVQGAWRRAFPDATGDPDALAGRLGCYGCPRRGSAGCRHDSACRQDSACHARRPIRAAAPTPHAGNEERS